MKLLFSCLPIVDFLTALRIHSAGDGVNWSEEKFHGVFKEGG